MSKISSFQHILGDDKSDEQGLRAEPNRTEPNRTKFEEQSSALCPIDTSGQVILDSIVVCVTFHLVPTVITCNILDSVWREKARHLKHPLTIYSQYKMEWQQCRAASSLFDATTPLIALCFCRLPCFTFISFVSLNRITSIPMAFVSHSIRLTPSLFSLLHTFPRRCCYRSF